MLFVWLAFGQAAFIYAIDWHPSGWSTLRQETAAKPPQGRGVEYYNGSIVIVPARGESCWQRMIDMSSARMNAIGKAFNHAGEN